MPALLAMDDKQLQAAGRRGRGTLSVIECGKAHRALLEVLGEDRTIIQFIECFEAYLGALRRTKYRPIIRPVSPFGAKSTPGHKQRPRSPTSDSLNTARIALKTAFQQVISSRCLSCG